MALTLKQALAMFWEQIQVRFVKRENGKGLSTNDFTTEEKNKLASLDNITVDTTLTIEGAAADAKAVGDAFVKSVADWNETDETSLAFIKNKPTEETEDDAFEMLVEMGIIIPVTDDENNIFADEDGTIFTV